MSDGISGGSPPDTPSRRQFLRTSFAALMSCPALAACEFIELRGGGGSIGGEGGGFPFSLNDPTYAALEEVGGHVCVALGPVEVALFRASEDEFLAFERICPHAGLDIVGCTEDGFPAEVTYDPEARELTCVWHQSVFGADGSLKSGPSPRGILVFPVEYDPESRSGRIVTTSDGSGEQAPEEAS